MVSNAHVLQLTVPLKQEPITRSVQLPQLKGHVQERPPDFWAIYESAQNQPNSGMWAPFDPRNTAPKSSSLGCSSFSRNNVCKKGTQVGKTEWFIAYAIS